MKYKNTPHKIKKLWSNHKKVSNSIDREKEDITSLKDNVEKVKVRKHLFKSGFEYDSGWIYFDFKNYSNSQVLYKNWEIEFSRMNVNFVPFINYALIYQGEDFDYRTFVRDDTSDFDIYQSDFIFIEDIEDEENDNIKKVTLNIGFYTSHNSKNLPDTKVRLYIDFDNPYKYLS